MRSGTLRVRIAFQDQREHQPQQYYAIPRLRNRNAAGDDDVSRFLIVLQGLSPNSKGNDTTLEPRWPVIALSRRLHADGQYSENFRPRTGFISPN